jgi:hypothetical protein
MSKIEPRSASWLKLSRRVTGSHVEVAFVDQGYTGDAAAEAAKEHGIRLEVVKRTFAKRALCSRLADGSWSARWLGPPVFAAWCVITSDFQPRLLACIWSPLRV